MSLQHILKNSSVSGKEPLASQLANGELSINYHADGPFLCCKDTAGNVRRVAGVWVSATAPSTPFPGELWLDTSITPSQLRVYKNTTDNWVFAGQVDPATTTYAGVVQLATNGETQAGTNATSAVTPAGLQSKISDSTSTVSSTTLASSTAVKAVGDTANAALPKSGGTITGTLDVIGATTLDSTLSVPLGSAAAPSIYPGADTNTGIYSPGADQLAISTNGTGRLFVDADGRVRATTTGLGINKTSQSGFDLDVNGLSILRGAVYFDSHSGISGDTTLNAPNGQSLVFKRGNVESARVDSSGRVGIGTSSPSSLLHCAGSSDVIGSLVSSGTSYAGLKFENSSRQYTLYIRPDTSNSLVVRDETSNAARITLDSSGNLGIGTSSPGSYNANLAIYSQSGGFSSVLHANSSGSFPKASAIALGSDAVSYTYSTDGGTVAVAGSAHIAAIQSASAGASTDIAFLNTSGGSVSERMRIDSSGRVGIGTSSPAVSLDIDGATGVYLRTGASSVALELGPQAGSTGPGIEYNVDGTTWVRGRTDAFPLAFKTNNTERLRIDSSGNVGIGTSSPTTLLDVNADTVRVRTARTPASATATGAAGEICWDASYIYVCTATNTWKRAALSTW